MDKGNILTLLFASLGIVSAALIMVFQDSGSKNSYDALVGFVKDFTLNLTIGIFVLYIMAYFIGGKMEDLIVNYNWHPIGTCVVGSLLILLFSSLAGTSVGFVEELLGNGTGGISRILFDYCLKPLFWIFFFGLIPTVILGSILGFLLSEA